LESVTLADRHWRLIDSNQARTSSLLRTSWLVGLFFRFILYYYKLMLVCVYRTDDSFTIQLLYQQTASFSTELFVRVLSRSGNNCLVGGRKHKYAEQLAKEYSVEFLLLSYQSEDRLLTFGLGL
jgi:hypothetical protein